MGSFSIWHLIVIMVIIFVLFGAGKLPKVMGDVGKGIKSLKEGLKEGESAEKKAVETDESKKV